MTLFSSIKYPISNPPTQAELDALPEKIYKSWLRSMGLPENAPTAMLAETWKNPLFVPASEVERAVLQLRILIRVDEM